MSEKYTIKDVSTPLRAIIYVGEKTLSGREYKWMSVPDLELVIEKLEDKREKMLAANSSTDRILKVVDMIHVLDKAKELLCHHLDLPKHELSTYRIKFQVEKPNKARKIWKDTKYYDGFSQDAIEGYAKTEALHKNWKWVETLEIEKVEHIAYLFDTSEFADL